MRGFEQWTSAIPELISIQTVTKSVFDGWAIRSVLFFIFVFSVFSDHFKFPMIGFDPRTSAIRNDHRATTNAHQCLHQVNV